MATVHFFGGEKGGVGKSLVTRTAIQYHLDRGEDFALFDADRSVADIKRIYDAHECGEIVFSKSSADEDKANPAYLAAENKTTLVNLPPNVMIPFWAWFDDNGIFELAEKEGVGITHWFVCSGHPDSIRLLDKYLSHFQGTINHVLVKNLIDYCDWSYLDKNEDIQQKLQDYNVKVLDFPLLRSSNLLRKIDCSALTFGEARECENFSFLDRHRVKSFLESAYSQFDNVGVFK